MNELLAKVKMALRLTTDDLDDEVTDLIQAALQDLGIAGVLSLGNITEPVIVMAVKTYCRAHFGEPENYDKLKAAYDEQKAQLQMTTGFTDWGDADAAC